MRTLAIDYGDKRVGLALSDAGGSLASPLDVIIRSTDAHLIQTICKTIEHEGAERVVLGLPLNMDGTVGGGAKHMIEFAKLLRQASGLDVILIDERLSSYDAEQQLISRKRAGEHLTRKNKKGQLDAIAAATFLQAFLDGNLSPITFDE